jgi:pilus assembly protein CpaB
MRMALIGLLAIVSGTGAVVLVNTALRPPTGATTSVVVAAVDVPRGAMLTEETIALKPFPKDNVPQGALTSKDEALERGVLHHLFKGEVILDGKLAKKGTGRGLAAMVPPGMRAFTIQTPNVAAGVAGFVLPGNRVDVLLTVSDNNLLGGMAALTGGGSTTTLLQNVEILAVDKNIDAPADIHMDPKDLRSVTLLVTPDQAAKLDLGQNKGTLHLSLRNHADDKAAVTRPATLADLRFMQEKPWDERARGLLDSLAKVLAARPPVAPAPKPEPAPAVSAPTQPAPRPIMIHTLRGNHAGKVQLELRNP